MPTAVIVIFLLFFAVLAFGWFYLQRAKARDTVATVDATPASVPTTTTSTATDRTDTPAA
jgi:Flp pilus assembly protein TadG